MTFLGDNADINLFNVKIYLGTIEKKLSGLITDLYFAERSVSKQMFFFSFVASTDKNSGDL